MLTLVQTWSIRDFILKAFITTAWAEVKSEQSQQTEMPIYA